MKKIISLILCISVLALGSIAMAEGPSDGTYTGTGAGKNGDVQVSVTFAGGGIASVEVGEHSETEGICEPAIERIPAMIVEHQSIAVDVVTGASVTSQAIIDAVADAIQQAGGSVEAFQNAVASAEKSTEVIDMDCDVVIVGAGGSGMAAAMAANQAGANVIIVEKAASIGGSSIMSMGMGAVGSSMQAESEMGDFTVSQWMSDWMDQQNYMVSAPMIYKYMTESGETVDWLLENGIEMNYTGHEQGALKENPIATYHVWSGEGLAAGLQKNLERIEANGGKIFLETAGKSIIMENGEAKGIVAEQSDGTTLNIHAKAVVISTGGYGASPEMIENVLGFKANGINSGGQTGDGINMGIEAGAATEGLENVEFHGVAVPFELKSFSMGGASSDADYVGLLVQEPSGVWVNVDGYRFANENICYDTAYLGNVASRQGDHFYCVINQKIVDAWENEGQASVGRVTANTGFGPLPVDQPWTGLTEQLEANIPNGAVIKAETLEELAEKTGMNADNLKATFEAYNASCANGVDEYMGKPAEFLTSMEEGPYYAIVGRSSELCTLGGLKVSTDLQVISTENKVIPGLYSAGVDCCGSMFNRVYVSYEGVTMGWTMTSGRLAGENAAAYAAK